MRLQCFASILLLTTGLEASAPKDPVTVKTKITRRTPEPPRAWTRWVEKYASTNALLAQNKAIPSNFHMTKEHLENLLLLKTKVTFKEKFLFGTREAADFDIATLGSGAHFAEGGYVDHMIQDGMNASLALEYSTRNRRIIEESQRLILNRAADELILIDIGGLHAMDLYLSSYLKDVSDPYRNRVQEIHYFACPRDANTPFSTPEYHEMIRSYSGLEPSFKVAGDALGHVPIVLLARVLLFRRWSADRYTVKELLLEPKGTPGALVLLDLHGLQSTGCIQDLPTAADLRQMGFKQVTLATETFKAGREVSDEEYGDRSRIVAKDLNFDGFEPSQKKRIVDAVTEKRIIRLPIQEALLNRLKELRRAGLKTRILGLEPLDPTEIKERTKSGE